MYDLIVRLVSAAAISLPLAFCVQPVLFGSAFLTAAAFEGGISGLADLFVSIVRRLACRRLSYGCVFWQFHGVLGVIGRGRSRFDHSSRNLLLGSHCLFSL